VTLQWSFAILCHYPVVQKKVAEEIDQFIKVNGRIPEFTERNEVPYCISVIKECMRFKPTTPFGLPHFVNKDGKSYRRLPMIFLLIRFSLNS
jgi:cytochrome P450